MKRLAAILLIGTLGATGASFAQTSQETSGAKQDMKTAGHDVKGAAKATGRATKKGAKEVGHTTKHTTKRVVHKGAHKTKQGAGKVEQNTQTPPPPPQQ